MRSSRLPIGVGQTISSPGISRLPCSELDPRHRRGADHPGVGPELGGDDRRLVHRRQRPRRAARARAGSSSRSPAAITPPPITITSGSKMLAKLASATPRRRADQVEDADRGLVAGERRLGHRLAVDLARPSAEHRAERRVRLALGRRPRPRGRAPCRRRAPRRSRGSGQLPWQGGPSASITMWPSSAPAPVEPR